MDNKKWSKRFSTLFWWFLTILPWLYVFFVLIASIFNVRSDSSIMNFEDLSSYCINVFNNCFNSYTYNTFFIKFMSIDSLTISFSSLFSLLGVTNTSFLSISFSWMLSVQVYHLIFDVIAWFPSWCHEFIERGRC